MPEIQPVISPDESIDISRFLLRLKQAGGTFLTFEWKPMPTDEDTGYMVEVAVDHQNEIVSCRNYITNDTWFRTSVPSALFRLAECSVLQAVLQWVEQQAGITSVA